jgi:hypothetical protein
MDCPAAILSEDGFLKAVTYAIDKIRTGQSRHSRRSRNAAAFAMAAHAVLRSKAQPTFARALLGRHRDLATSAPRATRLLFGRAERTHVLAIARISREELAPKTVHAMIIAHGLVNFAKGKSRDEAIAIDRAKMKNIVLTIAGQALPILGAVVTSEAIHQDADFALALLHRRIDGSFGLKMITSDLSKVTNGLRSAIK